MCHDLHKCVILNNVKKLLLIKQRIPTDAIILRHIYKQFHLSHVTVADAEKLEPTLPERALVTC